MAQSSPPHYLGGCQNYGPFLGTLNIRCRIIIGIQKRDHNFDNHPYDEYMLVLSFLFTMVVLRRCVI